MDKKIFLREESNKLRKIYPFLTCQQIRGKVLDSWRRLAATKKSWKTTKLHDNVGPDIAKINYVKKSSLKLQHLSKPLKFFKSERNKSNCHVKRSSSNFKIYDLSDDDEITSCKPDFMFVHRNKLMVKHLIQPKQRKVSDSSYRKLCKTGDSCESLVTNHGFYYENELKRKKLQEGILQLHDETSNESLDNDTFSQSNSKVQTKPEGFNSWKRSLNIIDESSTHIQSTPKNDKLKNLKNLNYNYSTKQFNKVESKSKLSEKEKSSKFLNSVKILRDLKVKEGGDFSYEDFEHIQPSSCFKRNNIKTKFCNFSSKLTPTASYLNDESSELFGRHIYNDDLMFKPPSDKPNRLKQTKLSAVQEDAVVPENPSVDFYKKFLNSVTTMDNKEPSVDDTFYEHKIISKGQILEKNLKQSKPLETCQNGKISLGLTSETETEKDIFGQDYRTLNVINSSKIVFRREMSKVTYEHRSAKSRQNKVEANYLNISNLEFTKVDTDFFKVGLTEKIKTKNELSCDVVTESRQSNIMRSIKLRLKKKYSIKDSLIVTYLKRITKRKKLQYKMSLKKNKKVARKVKSRKNRKQIFKNDDDVVTSSANFHQLDDKNTPDPESIQHELHKNCLENQDDKEFQISANLDICNLNSKQLTDLESIPEMTEYEPVSEFNFQIHENKSDGAFNDQAIDEISRLLIETPAEKEDANQNEFKVNLISCEEIAECEIEEMTHHTNSQMSNKAVQGEHIMFNDYLNKTDEIFVDEPAQTKTEELIALKKDLKNTDEDILKPQLFKTPRSVRKKAAKKNKKTSRKHNSCKINDISNNKKIQESLLSDVSSHLKPVKNDSKKMSSKKTAAVTCLKTSCEDDRTSSNIISCRPKRKAVILKEKLQKNVPTPEYNSNEKHLEIENDKTKDALKKREWCKKLRSSTLKDIESDVVKANSIVEVQKPNKLSAYNRRLLLEKPSTKCFNKSTDQKVGCLLSLENLKTTSLSSKANKSELANSSRIRTKKQIMDKELNKENFRSEVVDGIVMNSADKHAYSQLITNTERCYFAPHAVFSHVVDHSFSSAADNALNKTVEDTLNSAVDNTLTSALENTLDPAVENIVNPTAENVFDSTVKNAISSAVENAVTLNLDADNVSSPCAKNAALLEMSNLSLKVNKSKSAKRIHRKRKTLTKKQNKVNSWKEDVDIVDQTAEKSPDRLENSQLLPNTEKCSSLNAAFNPTGNNDLEPSVKKEHKFESKKKVCEEKKISNEEQNEDNIFKKVDNEIARNSFGELECPQHTSTTENCFLSPAYLDSAAENTLEPVIDKVSNDTVTQSSNSSLEKNKSTSAKRMRREKKPSNKRCNKNNSKRKNVDQIAEKSTDEHENRVLVSNTEVCSSSSHAAFNLVLENAINPAVQNSFNVPVIDTSNLSLEKQKSESVKRISREKKLLNKRLNTNNSCKKVIDKITKNSFIELEYSQLTLTTENRSLPQAVENVSNRISLDQTETSSSSVQESEKTRSSEINVMKIQSDKVEYFETPQTKKLTMRNSRADDLKAKHELKVDQAQMSKTNFLTGTRTSSIILLPETEQSTAGSQAISRIDEEDFQNPSTPDEPEAKRRYSFCHIQVTNYIKNGRKPETETDKNENAVFDGNKAPTTSRANTEHNQVVDTIHQSLEDQLPRKMSSSKKLNIQVSELPIEETENNLEYNREQSETLHNNQVCDQGLEKISINQTLHCEISKSNSEVQMSNNFQEHSQRKGVSTNECSSSRLTERLNSLIKEKSSSVPYCNEKTSQATLFNNEKLLQKPVPYDDEEDIGQCININVPKSSSCLSFHDNNNLKPACKEIQSIPNMDSVSDNGVKNLTKKRRVSFAGITVVRLIDCSNQEGGRHRDRVENIPKSQQSRECIPNAVIKRKGILKSSYSCQILENEALTSVFYNKKELSENHQQPVKSSISIINISMKGSSEVQAKEAELLENFLRLNQVYSFEQLSFSSDFFKDSRPCSKQCKEVSNDRFTPAFASEDELSNSVHSGSDENQGMESLYEQWPSSSPQTQEETGWADDLYSSP